VEKRAVEKLLRKLIRKPSRTPRVMVTDKLGAYGAARTGMDLNVEHRRHKGLNHMGLNNRAENAHLPTLRRKRIMKWIMKRIIKRSTSARHLKRLVFFPRSGRQSPLFPATPYCHPAIGRFVPGRSSPGARSPNRVSPRSDRGKAPGESARESSPSSHGRRSAS